MKYQINDRVKLTVSKSYANGDDLPAGTKGTVTGVLPLSKCYWIDFDGAKSRHKVAEQELANG